MSSQSNPPSTTADKINLSGEGRRRGGDGERRIEGSGGMGGRTYRPRKTIIGWRV
jgi:hypothetical protein